MWCYDVTSYTWKDLTISPFIFVLAMPKTAPRSTLLINSMSMCESMRLTRRGLEPGPSWFKPGPSWFKEMPWLLGPCATLLACARPLLLPDVCKILQNVETVKMLKAVFYLNTVYTPSSQQTPWLRKNTNCMMQWHVIWLPSCDGLGSRSDDIPLGSTPPWPKSWINVWLKVKKKMGWNTGKVHILWYGVGLYSCFHWSESQ